MWGGGESVTIRGVVQKRESPEFRSPEVGISVSESSGTSGKVVLFYLLCVAIRLYLSGRIVPGGTPCNRLYVLAPP